MLEDGRQLPNDDSNDIGGGGNSLAKHKRPRAERRGPEEFDIFRWEIHQAPASNHKSTAAVGLTVRETHLLAGLFLDKCISSLFDCFSLSKAVRLDSRRYRFSREISIQYACNICQPETSVSNAHSFELVLMFWKYVMRRSL